ncbi:hypothetical protein EV359DRAFT_85744 [Lentinula novae-zelandiae]|nr:hypothetical protein EV359DRAFT_85744 [Lentinula novae-zelandiae]
MKDIPIPRTGYKDAESELVLENLDASSFNLVPSRIDVDAKTHVIPASATMTLAPATGSASRNAKATPGSSLTNHPAPAPLATATKTVSQRSLHHAFHVIEHLDVRITDEFELDIKDSNHGVMIAMFKPIMALR